MQRDPNPPKGFEEANHTPRSNCDSNQRSPATSATVRASTERDRRHEPRSYCAPGAWCGIFDELLAVCVLFGLLVVEKCDAEEPKLFYERFRSLTQVSSKYGKRKPIF